MGDTLCNDECDMTTTIRVQTVRTIRLGHNRKITDVTSNKHNYRDETTLELDSHADTCVLGRDALIVSNYDRPVDVEGYDKTLGTKRYDTVSGVLAYDHPLTGEVYHLIVHQAIHIPHLDHHLLCPMQCRVNDVKVSEVPKCMTDDPTDETHALTIYDDDDPTQATHFPLALRGVTSLLNVRKPTLDEYNSDVHRRFHLTSEHLTWDPSTTMYEEQEAAMIDHHGDIVRDGNTTARGRLIVNELSSLTNDAVDFTSNDNFHVVLRSCVIASIGSTTGTGHIKSMQNKPIDHLTLAERWMIPPDKALQTIRMTTQKGVRTCLNPSLSQRYPTNDRFLRYPRLPENLFGDTLIAGTKSARGNSCAQVWTARNGWTRGYPIKRKGQAHEALSLLFRRDGVPPCMILDGSKEQTLGEFRRKLKEADCHLRQTEPYSPWQQAAEGAIRELKRGISRKMTGTGSPKVLWDHCLELEALIRSNSVNGIYETNGQVPETIMKGSTADISHISEYKWYDWVMFRDNLPTFPDDKLILGRYLGPATDVGSMMTAKILKENGQFVCRSTLRRLTQEELDSPVHSELRRKFTESIDATLGPGALESDFEPEDLTPELPPYDDHGKPDGDDDEPAEEVTPETGDNYVNTEISISKGGSLARGRVTSRKRDADGNPTGRANDNPVLDTRVYNVEFDDGDVTELTANMIAQAMYSQCDHEGNQYMLLKGLIDHRKKPDILTIAEQHVQRENGRVYRHKTTIGWQLCCQWEDGSTTWENLKLLKESHPIATAEYAVAHGIDHEPAFNWWVKRVLKKRECIISLVKQRQLPRSTPILCYVDDILCIHHDAMTVLKRINKYLPLKPDSVGDPDMYLGAKLRQTELTNGVWAWALSPSKYVNQAVKNCETHLRERFDGKYSLPKKAKNPYRMGYEPELDESSPLDADAAAYYQSIIGVMRWMVEIGRIDISTEVSLLSSHLAYPREGHLEEALHIMAYLRSKHNSRLVFDPSYPDIDQTDFKQCDWKEFYGDAVEGIPLDAPEPLGKDVDIRMMVDSDHAGDKLTRRSRTGFLIFVNSAIVEW